MTKNATAVQKFIQVQGSVSYPSKCTSPQRRSGRGGTAK